MAMMITASVRMFTLPPSRNRDFAGDSTPRGVNWEGEPASRFPLPTLATKIRGSLLPFPTDLLIGV
jgi:hypothetical protein